MDSAELFVLLNNYETQSLEHAVTLPEQVGEVDVWSGIGFRLREHHLVAELGTVSEILTVPAFTKVPTARPWLLGVSNIRGNLVSMVDLRHYFYGERTHLGKRCRVLVIRQEGGMTGLLVDEVFGLRHFESADASDSLSIDDPTLTEFLTREFVRDGQRWIAFDAVDLVESADFLNAAA
jgi:twitching motility protein PilI